MRQCRFLMLMAVIVWLGACASRTVQTRVMRPAEINMAGYEQVWIGAVDGEGAPLIRAKLIAAIAGAGNYRVVDRDTLGAAMREQELAQYGVTKANGEATGYTAASTLITGSILRHNYNQWRTNQPSEYGYYYQTHLMAFVTASLKVVDLQTMEVIATDVIEAQSQQYYSIAQLNWSPDIDPSAAFNECYDGVVANFMRKIAPYEETVPVELYLVGNAAGTKSGYEFFKGGNYGQALTSFAAAAEQERSSPKCKPETLARVLYNAGLAAEYCGDFVTANRYYGEALSACHDSLYTDAMNRVATRAKEQQRMAEQGIVPP